METSNISHRPTPVPSHRATGQAQTDTDKADPGIREKSVNYFDVLMAMPKNS